MDALGSQAPQKQFTPPWFRQDFAVRGEALVTGAESILANPHFLAAARTITGPDAVVRPSTVYVNLMGPTPFPFPMNRSQVKTLHVRTFGSPGNP